MTPTRQLLSFDLNQFLRECCFLISPTEKTQPNFVHSICIYGIRDPKLRLGKTRIPDHHPIYTVSELGFGDLTTSIPVFYFKTEMGRMLNHQKPVQKQYKKDCHPESVFCQVLVRGSLSFIYLLPTCTLSKWSLWQMSWLLVRCLFPQQA